MFHSLSILEMLLGLGLALVAVAGSIVTIVKTISGARFMRISDWSRVSEAVRKAEHRVWILQTWVPDLQVRVDDWRHALVNQPNIDFRVLLLDLDLVPFRLRGRERERIASQTAFNVQQINVLMATYNTTTTRISARFYAALPFGPVCIIDDVVYWGIYTAHQDALKLPALIHSVKSLFGMQIFRSFERMWEIGTMSSQTLNFDGNLSRADAPHALNHADSEEALESIQRRYRSKFSRIVNGRPLEGSPALIVIRAAQTDLDSQGILIGHLNIGINAEGRKSAQVMGRDLLDWSGVSEVWSSPLRRAFESANYAFGGSGVQIESLDELRDRRIGDLEGYKESDYYSSLPAYVGVDMRRAVFFRPGEDAESPADVVVRVEPAVRRAASRLGQGQTVVMVTHEAVVNAVEFLVGGAAVEVLGDEVSHNETRIYVLNE